MAVRIHFQRIVCALVLSLISAHASALTSIVYQVFDLSDIVQGQDLWRYSYSVSGNFALNHGFEILFDAQTVTSLEDNPLSPNAAQWEVSTIPPAPGISADGVFMAQAKVASPSSAAPFEVAFVWQGPGVPGPQTFSVLDEAFLPLESATTQLAAIPEPHSYLTFGAGLLLLVALARHRRNSARASFPIR